MPKLYVTPDAQPNAFATGRNPDHAAVAVTQGILQICTWDELRGVLAHEISHVGNRDILISSVAATIAMAITLLATLARVGRPLLRRTGTTTARTSSRSWPSSSWPRWPPSLLQLALSRSREYEADRSGARLIGDGEPLARALAKLEAGAQRIPMPQVRREMAPLYIVSPLAGMNVSFKNLFSDHPPTEDRIARLRSKEWAR